ncbi:uncharacterized protein LOC114396981 [Glycine soja]|uniref:uncharacterized protein LOC114396981 n=1 Tax=Glycine soja TaxID=3848 RepID=UPI001040C6DE|nr:uncharacterized protein LOC114396981 [Glycine soja]
MLHGFGLHDSSNTYKVVIVTPYAKLQNFEVRVHNMVILVGEMFCHALLFTHWDPLMDSLRVAISSVPYLRVLKGCLCLARDYKRTHFVVWLMKEFGVEKSWTQLLNVSYEHIKIEDPYMQQ